jgi:hypothetical protein
MSLNVGILIVGSLYWDRNENRENWRNNRLNGTQEYIVYAPIRYGRRSITRNNTYTMVFSNLCLRRSHGKGLAKVIGCRYLVNSIENLIVEAELLWAAERNEIKPNGRISAGWGSVALLSNPGSKIPNYIIDAWEKRVKQEVNYGNIRHTNSELPVLKTNGFLNIPWPDLKKDSSPVPFDLILATVTNPTLQGDPPTYPRAREIATAWKQDKSGNDEYFWQNKENGIHTYQDPIIEKILKS